MPYLNHAKMNPPKAKVLIIDDEQSFTKLARLTLTEYELREENDSTQALKTAKEFQPDLILLDVMMPNLDGGDVAAQIRAEPSLKNVPIVFLTAMVTRQEANSQPQLGGFPFISKPVAADVLVQNIERYLKAG